MNAVAEENKYRTVTFDVEPPYHSPGMWYAVVRRNSGIFIESGFGMSEMHGNLDNLLLDPGLEVEVLAIFPDTNISGNGVIGGAVERAKRGFAVDWRTLLKSLFVRKGRT